MRNKKILKSDNCRDLLGLFLLTGLVFIQFCYYVLRRGGFALAPDWQSIELTFNYSDYGLIRRGLMGELSMWLASLLKVEYSYKFISHFELAAVLIFTVMTLGAMFYFAKKIDSENKSAFFLLCLAFVSFGGISFYYLDWAEPDVYMIPLTLISVICALKDKFLFLIPINCALCTLIHEGYPMMFFFIVMAILFYKWMSLETSLINKYSVVLLISGLITSVLFVYLYFFSSCKEGVTLTDMDRRAQELTNADQIQNIEFLFFNGDAPMFAFWIHGKPTVYFVRNVINIILVGLLYAPVLWTVWRIQIRTIKAAATTQDRLKYIVCFGGFALVIPLFVVHTDTGRWLHDFFFYEFLITVFLLIARDSYFSEEVRNTLKNKINVALFLAPYFILNFNMEKEWMYHLTNGILNAIMQFMVSVKHLIF